MAEKVKDSETLQRVFTNKGPRDRVPPKSTLDREVTAHDKSSSGGRFAQPRRVETFTRAPARDNRAAKKKKAAEEARETAEVAPDETQAVTMKPEARNVVSGKKK